MSNPNTATVKATAPNVNAPTIPRGLSGSSPAAIAFIKRQTSIGRLDTWTEAPRGRSNRRFLDRGTGIALRSLRTASAS